MNTQRISLDLSKAPTYAQMVVIGQGDASGTTIVADVYDNGVEANLAGMSARFCMRFKGSAGYVRDANCSVSGSQITYVVDESHCGAVAGRADECYFEILSGDTVRYSTARFRVMVLRAVDSGTDAASVWDADFDIWKSEKDSIVGATVNAANAVVEEMRQDVDDLRVQADDVIDRAEDAIDAMGDIAELAVPLMTVDTRGGAKLGRGLAVEDGALSVELEGESDGTEAGPISELTAKGHAEQVSTTGKNLLPNGDDASTTYATVTITRKDGVLTFNGTSTTSGGRTASFYKTQKVTLDAGTYTFSVETSGTGDITAFVERLSDNQIIANSASAPAFTLDEPTEVYVGCNVANEAAYSITVKPQIELGSTATSYEPYTGGAPSPSPDYPQEIQVVRGRNLLNEALMEGKFLGLGGGGYDAGVAYDSQSSRTSEYIEVLPSETYVLSTGKSAALQSQNARAVCFYAKDKSYISLIQYNPYTSSQTILIETPSNAAYIRLTIDASKLGISQLERGFVATPYMPYGHVGLEAQGKNLWGGEKMADDAVAAVNVATSCKKAYDEYGRHFTLRAGTQISKPLTSGQFKESTQYTLILKVAHDVTGVSTNMVVTYTDGTMTHVKAPYSYESSPIAFAFVTDANKSLTDIRGGYYSGVTRFYYDECGLFEGVHTVDEFEPYHHSITPIPLPSRGWVAGLPNGIADTLTLDGAGKVVWEKETNEIVLDSSEGSWYVHTSIASWFYNDSIISDMDNDKGATVGTALASSFIQRSYGDRGTLTDGQFAVGASGTNTRIVFKNTDYTTVADFKTWLSTHPVTVLYPLATPVTENMGYADLPDIPEGASLSIPELDALGVRYITDDAAAMLAHQWYERARSEYENRIAALEEAVAEIIAG